MQKMAAQAAGAGLSPAARYISCHVHVWQHPSSMLRFVRCRYGVVFARFVWLHTNRTILIMGGKNPSFGKVVAWAGGNVVPQVVIVLSVLSVQKLQA